MAMNKKQFIALADVIRDYDSGNPFYVTPFSPAQISCLADFCQSQNPDFNRERWLGYIAETNGPSGGAR